MDISCEANRPGVGWEVILDRVDGTSGRQACGDGGGPSVLSSQLLVWKDGAS